MPKPKSGTTPKSAQIPITPAEPKTDRRRASATLVKRIMDEAMRLGSDRRVGTALGRLYLEGVISESECEAGFLYAEDVGRYERAKRRPRRTAKSASYDDGFGDSSVDLDVLHRMDPEAAKKLEDKIKRRVKKAYKRYTRCQVVIGAELVDPWDENSKARFNSRPRIINAAVLDELCCNDLPVHSIHHPEIKRMLRRLADVIYVLKDSGDDAPAEPKKRRIKPGDAKALGEATVDAIAFWFEQRRGTVRYFRIQATSTPSKRTLAVFGSNEQGQLTRSMKVGAKGVHAAVMDAALLKAAIAKGWAEMPNTPIPTEVSVDALRAGITRLKGGTT